MKLIKLSTVSIESLEKFVGLLKSSPPGHDETHFHSKKGLFFLDLQCYKYVLKALRKGSSQIVQEKSNTIHVFKAGDSTGKSKIFTV